MSAQALNKCQTSAPRSLLANPFRILPIGFFMPILLLFAGHVGAQTSSEGESPPLRGPIMSVKILDQSDCYFYDLLQTTQSSLGLREVPASLGWTTSGVWRMTEGDAEFILADHTYSRLIRNTPGSLVYEGPKQLHRSGTADHNITAKSLVELQEPLSIFAREKGGHVVLDVAQGMGKIYFLNESGEVEEPTIEVRNRTLYGEDSKQYTLTGVFRIAPYQDGVLAFTNVESPTGDAEWQFLHLKRSDRSYNPLSVDLSGGSGKPSNEPEPAKVGKPTASDWERTFYLRDFNYMTTIGDTAFILVQRETPHLAKIDLRTREINYSALPAELNLHLAPPDVPSYFQLKNHREYVKWSYEIYREIENQRMPTGIYSFEDHLFLLIKDAMNSESYETQWQLVEISQEAPNQVVSSLTLPTFAADIVLIPGTDFWGILEKGPIDIIDGSPAPVLYRPSKTMRLLPTSWLFSASRASGSFPNMCQRILVGGLP